MNGYECDPLCLVSLNSLVEDHTNPTGGTQR